MDLEAVDRALTIFDPAIVPTARPRARLHSSAMLSVPRYFGIVRRYRASWGAVACDGVAYYSYKYEMSTEILILS